MKQFYTKEVSDEVVSSLKSKNYPISQIDMGSTVPQIIELKPTYAEVLDWLLNKDIEISVFQECDKTWVALTNINEATSIGNFIREEGLISALDKALLFILDFI